MPTTPRASSAAAALLLASGAALAQVMVPQQPQPTPKRIGAAPPPPTAAQAVAPDRPATGDEAPRFKNLVRLTSPDKFVKAGEAYFDPYTRWIIFQAVPKPADNQTPDEHYSMFVARLLKDPLGHIVGIDEPIRLSPPGSASTCGFFNPLSGYKVIFGCTLVPPKRDPDAKDPGFHRENSRYVWEFPAEMEVCTRTVNAIFDDLLPVPRDPSDKAADAEEPLRLFSRPGYDAECSYSPDARLIVYTHLEPGSNNPDIYIYDIEAKAHIPIVTAPGYDGGPFFSPDGKRICYRSDRKGNDLLQVMVADLNFEAPPPPPAKHDEEYVPPPPKLLGLKTEHAVTANEHVNWAPFWSPDGSFLIYATSEIGHDNYELFTVETPAAGADAKAPADLNHRRITTSVGFDGLPAFSREGRFVMWTSQRPSDPKGLPLPPTDPRAAQKETSQIWVAEVLDIKP